jgi:adenylate cyclase
MLTVFWHDDEGDHGVRVENPFSWLGRSPEADLRIASASVSRRHAVLAESGGRWTLRDVGSQNGTSVDGLLVREHVIQDGDTVSLGPDLWT